MGSADIVLRQTDASLDNNVSERAFKKAILHRKNALFCKTKNGGAGVSDLFMSLIWTCQPNQLNPFDYSTSYSAMPTCLRPLPNAEYRGTTARRSRGHEDARTRVPPFPGPVLPSVLTSSDAGALVPSHTALAAAEFMRGATRALRGQGR